MTSHSPSEISFSLSIVLVRSDHVICKCFLDPLQAHCAAETNLIKIE
jgi:hypothetical protein